MQPITISKTGTGRASQWVRFDDWGTDDITVQAVVSGTATYSIEITMDDPNSITNPVAVGSVTWSQSTAASGATTTLPPTPLGVHPVFASLNITAGTGTVTATFLQGSVVPR